MSHLTLCNKNFSFQNLLQKFLIPRLVAKTSQSTIPNKNFSLHNSEQKLLIKTFVARNVSFHSLQQNLLIPQFAAKRCHSTICWKNFSFYNLQQNLLIPQFTAESFSPQFLTKISTIHKKCSQSTIFRKLLSKQFVASLLLGRLAKFKVFVEVKLKLRCLQTIRLDL